MKVLGFKNTQAECFFSVGFLMRNSLNLLFKGHGISFSSLPEK